VDDEENAFRLHAANARDSVEFATSAEILRGIYECEPLFEKGWALTPRVMHFPLVTRPATRPCRLRLLTGTHLKDRNDAAIEELANVLVQVQRIAIEESNGDAKSKPIQNGPRAGTCVLRDTGNGYGRKQQRSGAPTRERRC